MFQSRKNLIIFLAIVFLIGAGFFYLVEIKKVSWLNFFSAPSETTVYSYQNIAYNFWGLVKEKQGDIILVEGIVPDPGENLRVERTPIMLTFKIAADTKIVKLENEEVENQQVFVGLEAIKIGDKLALKADQIDTKKEKITATDILILPSVPSEGLTGEPVILPPAVQ